MTYCVGIKLNAGLVFLSDSRTNAGVDNISTFRKMIVYERPGDRFMVLLSAGNLSISQSVREILQVEQLQERADGRADHDLERQEHVRRGARAGQRGAPRVRPRRRVAEARRASSSTSSLIFGGQIRGEGMRLFQVYSAGNFIEATTETPYFQIGESKYGKPVLDRVITPETPLDEAAKCALVSMDSTMKSNLSVGPAAGPGGVRSQPLPDRQDRVHRHAEPLLPHAAQQLGPEAARGVRQPGRPGVGRRAHRHAAEDARRPQQAAEEDHAPRTSA